jgi:hypothetical protein
MMQTMLGSRSNKLERQRTLEAHKGSTEKGKSETERWRGMCIRPLGEPAWMQSILDMYAGRVPSLTASIPHGAVAQLEHCPRIASPLTLAGEVRGPPTLDEVKTPECRRSVLGWTGCEASKR